jgi:hypothetical protein
MQILRTRYEAIEASLQHLSELPTEALESSRALFEMRRTSVTPRRFDVWTCVCGLPVPRPLANRLREAARKVQAQLLGSTRTYWVDLANYHWELFVIKRPDDYISEVDLQRGAKILEEVFAAVPPFTIAYRGLLITLDGTVIARGYGDFDGVRGRLQELFPFASQRQSNLGHISLGRILDPIGRERFAALKVLVAQSCDEAYGTLPVHEVKYVHEHQWYMEDREIVGAFRLRTAR